MLDQHHEKATAKNRGIVLIGLIQRVKSSSVVIDEQTFSSIQHGILLLVGIEKTDGQPQIDKLIKKILNYRIFEDEQGKMNLNLQQVDGELLIVSQFTLVADTKSGNRPSFSKGAPMQQGQEIYDQLVATAKTEYKHVQTGSYGADMKVHLINDGPVTFQFDIK